MTALSNHSRDLQRRILLAWRPSSYLWLVRHSHGLDRCADHEVEVRVDLPPDVLRRATFAGWTVAHQDLDRGMVFLRRYQPLTNKALRRLFRDAICIAHAGGGRFHSWLHAPELTPWD